MPRRRPRPAPDAPDQAEVEAVRRRLAYLVTNRHRAHEASVLVLAAMRDGGDAPTPDTRRLADEVRAWIASRGLDWDDNAGGYWRVRTAVAALRPHLA